MNNFEKIKNMNIDEITKFLYKKAVFMPCRTCGMRMRCRGECVKDWLLTDDEIYCKLNKE